MAEKSLPRATFRYHERLHRQKDFQNVLKSGRRLFHPAVSIYMYQRPDGEPLRRLGLITSRKIGNAAQRNRVKRYLRETFRLNKHSLPPAADIIMMPRKPATDLDYHALRAIILELLGIAPEEKTGI